MTKQHSNNSIRLKVGNAIKQLRAENKMSQRDLAEVAHITNSNIANIELGKYSVGLDVLSRILDALNCDLNIEKRK